MKRSAANKKYDMQYLKIEVSMFSATRSVNGSGRNRRYRGLVAVALRGSIVVPRGSGIQIRQNAK